MNRREFVQGSAVLATAMALQSKAQAASAPQRALKNALTPGSIGVSENFLGKVERGSESVQWGKLFQVLDGLGVRVMVDVPDSVAAYLHDSASRDTKS